MSDNTSNKNAMKESRIRTKNKQIVNLMEKNPKLSREDATKIATDNIRKKNSQDRQRLRMQKAGRTIIKKPLEQEERKEQYITEPLFPFTEKEIKKIKGPLPVEKLNILDDDKKLFNKLSYTEQKLVNRMNRNRKTKTSMRSLVQYIQKVKQIYKKDNQTFTGSNIGLLLDEKKTMNILESNYKNSKDYLWSIINVLKSFPTTESDVKYYSDKMGDSLKKSKTEIRDNMKNEKEKQNWMSYNKIVELYKKNKEKLNDNDRLLMQFVIQFPRRLDWRLMKLHKTGKKDFNYNYLNVNRYGMPSSFQFFRSKSQDYEETTKKIPNKLKNNIMTYLRDNDIKNNQLLFPNKSRAIHSADSFSKHITLLFKKITGKSINNNLYRHIVATNLSDKGYSMNQRSKVASDMGHNLIQSLQYVKR